MRTTWLVNGTTTTIDPSDRGLAYGDGLFETMAVLGGRIRRLDLHLARLADGCRRLQISPPDPAAIAADFDQLRAGESSAVAKLIVTRGTGTRGYLPDPDAQSTRIFGIHPWPDYPQAYYADGVAMRNCTLRLSENRATRGTQTSEPTRAGTGKHGVGIGTMARGAALRYERLGCRRHEE